MKQGFTSNHWTDQPEGNPAGGCTTSNGFTISWQNGPLGRDGERREPNGAFVEDVIDAAADRIRFYQDSKFKCDDNAEALQHLESAIECMQRRKKNRESRAVEGTHAT